MYQDLLERFVQRNVILLGDNLIGIYLHGSAAMGCFNPKKSDIDLIIVVNDELSNEIKIRYMDMVLELNKEAYAKGLELSIVRGSVCKPFVYPTPFELHFSKAHLDWLRSDPVDYVNKMKGTDKDLAAHFTVIRHRGQTLYGKDITEVFSTVSKEYYVDSIWEDIKGAKSDIIDNPVYIILNLCRVMAYLNDNLILSKEEGGKWGLSNISEKYRNLIFAALEDYINNAGMDFDKAIAVEFSDHMLRQIRNRI